MKKITHYHRRFRLSIMRAGLLTLLICFFLFPTYIKFTRTGNNCFTLKINDTVVGTANSEEMIDKCLIQARKNIAASSDDLVFMDYDISVTGEEMLYGKTDSQAALTSKIENALKNCTMESLIRSYTVKINEVTFNLSSYEDVLTLLQEAIAPYDEEGLYDVNLVLDDTREVNALTTSLVLKEDAAASTDYSMSAGLDATIDEAMSEVESSAEKDFDDYQTGLIDISYGASIEVVESYLLQSELDELDFVVDYFTKEQETQKIYTVQSGDTLSGISIANNIPINDLIEMNDSLTDENSTIRVGQELILTVPEPELAVIWKDEQVIEEDYEAEVQYVYNDDWYTTQSQTLQEPSAGRRKIVAITTYENNSEIDREIVKEEVYAEAVPKIVEKGTKTPPTYIKPISGGTVSSGFGSRSAPKAGASTYHQGVDWAVATGTPVKASNGGTVVTAGWVSGYGYAIYINHSDGRQTRYGHLSKVLVSVGQTVTQGQLIAYSGNTGNSTGPHLHFEIRINGVAVNPLKYLN